MVANTKMNLFKKARSRSPSFDIPKLCLSRQKRTSEVPPATSTVSLDSVDQTVVPGTCTGKYMDSGGASAYPETEATVINNRPSKGKLKEADRAHRKTSIQNPDTSGPTLAVPYIPRIRSSSFDTSTLHHEEQDSDNTLVVPESQRSKSFDASYSGSSEENTSDKDTSSSIFLALPKYYRRRSLEIPKLCIHCVHLEALSSQETSPTSPGGAKFDIDKLRCSNFNYDSWDDFSSDDDYDSDDHVGCHVTSVSYTVRPGWYDDIQPIADQTGRRGV